MKVIGFNFSKISAERTKAFSEKVKIDSKINIKDLSEVNPSAVKFKEELINVSFLYGLDYNPNIAKILFEGNIVLALESKESKEILKEWKDKKMSDEFKLKLFNQILNKCNLKALQLEDELNIPPHFKLPSLHLDSSKE